ncbi:CBS domain-containing protein [Metallosphaera tengchongensis]|uniref:CBS domain-containing protein n=1 Tax=Metallosphaera tengchongensis TaxID=1532350 RepID=A0A6N0NXL0_9CREN|nr:CBS domain-containing protein [Metallosphaera tengchongensis]QKR00603.1 CBS domain-containing protein [Metallosphaera tengchongensis]
MKVKTFMNANPPIVSPNDGLKEAFKKVNDRGLGRVIVAENLVKGILSTRDLLGVIMSFCPVSCTQADLYKMGVSPSSNYMTPNPFVVEEEMDSLDAITIMVTRNFGSLPVVNSVGRVVGLVTERDFLLMFQDLDNLFSVSNFVTPRVNRVFKETVLQEAVRLMLRRGFRRLPVVDEDEKVVGMITAADAVKVASKAVEKLEPEIFFSRRVKDVMKSPVITVEEDRSVNEAASILINKGVGSLLILDNEGRAKGIITERDLLIALHYQLHLPYAKLRGKVER